MNTTLTLQVILSLIGLLATFFVWWNRVNDAKKKAIDDADKKIDAIANGDDVIHIADQLRHK